MGFREFAVKGLLINCSNLKGIRLFEEADEFVVLVGKIVCRLVDGGIEISQT